MLKLLFRMCRMAKKRNRHGGARNNSACRALEYPQDVPPGHDDADDVAIQQTLARSKAEHDAGSQHYRNMLKDLNAYMLQTAGRKAIDVPADGHCQAHALLEALREHDAQGVWTAVSLRNAQIDYMLANHAEYEDFAVDAENGLLSSTDWPAYCEQYRCLFVPGPCVQCRCSNFCMLKSTGSGLLSTSCYTLTCTNMMMAGRTKARR